MTRAAKKGKQKGGSRKGDFCQNIFSRVVQTARLVVHVPNSKNAPRQLGSDGVIIAGCRISRIAIHKEAQMKPKILTIDVCPLMPSHLHPVIFAILERLGEIGAPQTL